MGWTAETVVFLLLAPTGEVEPYSAFKFLTGSAPENLTKLPPNMPGSAASGPYNGYTLQVITRHGRVEIAFGVPPVDQSFGLISDPLAAVRDLQVLATKSLELMPANRLSMVTNLAHPTKDPEEAADLFFQATGAPRIEGAEPVDLLFQFNRPTTLPNGGLVNRITRWGVTRVQLMQISADVAASGSSPFVERSYHSLNRMLDINIAAAAEPIESTVARDIIQSLAKETSDLISDDHVSL